MALKTKPSYRNENVLTVNNMIGKLSENYLKKIQVGILKLKNTISEIVKIYTTD